MSLEEFVKEFYMNLIESDWKMNEIEEMDIMFYFEILAYRSNKQESVGIEAVL